MKCQCQHCAGVYEYEAGSTSDFCPHCGKETVCAPSHASKVPTTRRCVQPRLAQALIVILGGVVCLLAVFLVSSQKSNRHLRTQLKAQAEQIFSLQSQLSESQRAAHSAAITERLARDDQNVRDTIAGIYEYETPTGETSVLDFRADGSVKVYWYYSYHSETPYGGRMSTWAFSGDLIYVDGVSGGFKPDGDDLIDSAGSRWVRTR